MNIGIVGCGAIGSALAVYIDTQLGDVMVLTAVMDLARDKAERVSRRLRHRPAVVPLTPLIQRVDLVIEAASASVAHHIAQQALDAGRDVLVMSVGGLLGRYEPLRALAATKRARLLIPSGAVGGLDAIKAMAGDGDLRVTLTSRKPPRAFAGAPYVDERQLDLDAMRESTTIYAGTATEAVIGFPQNANIAATLALCVGAPEQVHVELIADPTVTVNRHEITAESSWGTARMCMESHAANGNPKTSASAIASAQALLKSLTEAHQIGT